MARVSLSHWGLVEYPPDRVPRVGEVGHDSYPYCLLARRLYPNLQPSFAWSNLLKDCRAVGVSVMCD